MLPRLRFVVAAALIAALPWFVVGSGLLTTAQNNALSEFPRQNSAAALSTTDLRDAHHMHIMAYVRRSRELSKLRELGEAPLSVWVASPSGRDETATPAPDVPTEVAKTKAASLQSDPVAVDASPDVVSPVVAAPGNIDAPQQSRRGVKLETADQPLELSLAATVRPIRRPPLPRAKPFLESEMPRVALLPPDPVAQEAPLLDLIPPVSAPAKSDEPQPAPTPTVAEPAANEAVQQLHEDVEVTASFAPPDFTPPLPRARPGPHDAATHRARRSRFANRPADAPFGLPPATLPTRNTPSYGLPQ